MNFEFITINITIFSGVNFLKLQLIPYRVKHLLMR